MATKKPDPAPVEATPSALDSMDYCPLHLRVFPRGSQCSIHGIVPCPKPKPVDATKSVVVSCSRCNLVKAVTAADIMRGGPKMTQRTCQRDKCVAEVMPSVSVPLSNVPPPIAGE